MAICWHTAGWPRGSGCHKPLAAVQMPPVPPVGCHHAQYNFCRRGAHCVKSPHPIITYHLKAIPHNSKCRYGERGAADAKPKAQIILDAAKVSAASGGNSEPKQGQRSQSARGFCPRSTMRVPQPDIIEHFGNADAVPQPPERCLSRKAGIMRCCLNITTFLPPPKSRSIFLLPGAYPWCRGEVL